MIPGAEPSYTIGRLQKVMPQASAFNVRNWSSRGWLFLTDARNIPTCHKGAKWVILAPALERFMVNPDTWHAWEAEAITLPCMREWAIQQRVGCSKTWLTVQEYAVKCGYEEGAIRRRIHEGLFGEGQVAHWNFKYYVRHDAPCHSFELPVPRESITLCAPRECIDWYREQGGGNVSAGMRAVWERMRAG